ncbi:MAG: zinc dependent phospholipase C family protein [Lachnospiraceae bacterium]|nr:zinc dependent phospholipase C family protein [Lachnospiraceae bacterium]
MPGFTTHYLFGADTYKKLEKSPLKNAIQKQHNAYSLGLQGPDLFFYFLPSYIIHKNNIGSVAHTEKTGVFLHYLLNSRKLFSDPLEKQIAEAYIAGFLGHYTLDTRCHPYVYWKTEYQKKDNRYYGIHMSLETDIDAELLQFYKHCPPSSFHPEASIRLSKKQLHTIALILHYVYAKTYPELNIHYLSIYASVRSIQLGIKFLQDPAGKKKRIIGRLEQLFLGYTLFSSMIPSDTLTIHIDPLNILRRSWKNPWDTSITSNDSFLDLIEQAQKDYFTLLADLNQLFTAAPSSKAEHTCRKKLLKALGNNSYHSGLDAGIPS